MQMVEQVAPTIIEPLLSELKVFIDKRMSGQIQILADSLLPGRDVPVNIIRTELEQVLPLYPQQSLHET